MREKSPEIVTESHVIDNSLGVDNLGCFVALLICSVLSSLRRHP